MEINNDYYVISMTQTYRKIRNNRILGIPNFVCVDKKFYFLALDIKMYTGAPYN